MNNYFYLDKNNQQQGPISPQQFIAYGVTADTLVWCNGMDNWTRAGNISELNEFVSAQNTNTPPPPHQPNMGNNNHSQPPLYNMNVGHQGATPPCPDSNMVWAILSTICCCLPCGIVSIVYASKVNSRYLTGDYLGAVEASSKAKTWAIVSLVLGLVWSTIYGIIYSLQLGAMGASLL